ncbi:MAG: hypothetical protein ACJ798_15965 [Phenylobacterium sp.]
MARAFDLFDDATHDHLNRIRRIRNQFAHAKHLIDFEDDLIIAEVRGAKLPAKPHSKGHKEIRRVRSRKTHGRLAYILLCHATYVKLIGRYSRSLSAGTENMRRKRHRGSVVNPFSNALLSRQPGLIGGQLAEHLRKETGNSITLEDLPAHFGFGPADAELRESKDK